MSKYDHTHPTAHYKKYLDAEGKWKGNIPCVCTECKDRRKREGGNPK